MKEERKNHRNEVRVVTIMKDGTERIEFKPKKFSAPRYGDYKAMWKQVDQAPKPNSKRQQRLRQQAAQNK